MCIEYRIYWIGAKFNVDRICSLHHTRQFGEKFILKLKWMLTGKWWMTLLLDISSDADIKKSTLNSQVRRRFIWNRVSTPFSKFNSYYILVSQNHRILRIIVEFIPSTFFFVFALENLSVWHLWLAIEKLCGECTVCPLFVMFLNQFYFFSFWIVFLQIIKNIRQVNESARRVNQQFTEHLRNQRIWILFHKYILILIRSLASVYITHYYIQCFQCFHMYVLCT